MVFGLFGSVAHELHFCVCAGYRLLICYGPLPRFFFTASKLQFRHRVEGLRTHRFWLARARLVVAFGLFGSVASSFSDPSFFFVSVQVIGCLSATVLYLCFFLRLRSCSFGTVWKGCERIVFGLPELGL